MGLVGVGMENELKNKTNLSQSWALMLFGQVSGWSGRAGGEMKIKANLSQS